MYNLPKENSLPRAARTDFLNTRMRSIKPGIAVERARLVTESYKKTEGMPYILRRAEAFKYILENMTLFIDEEELIIGNHAEKARYAPMFPEFGIFSEKELDLMPERKVDTLQITEEDKRYLLEDIFPYWETVSTGERAKYFFSDLLLDNLDSPYRVFNPLSRTRSGHGHYAPDVKKIVDGGFESVEADAKERLTTLDFIDPDYAEKMQFYQAVLIVIEGIKCWQNRYAALAESMAEQLERKMREQTGGQNGGLTREQTGEQTGRQTGEPTGETADLLRRITELRLIAETCRQVPYRPARSFFEAVQSFWFVILLDYLDQNGSSVSDGRFDQVIRDYYDRDIEAGKITRDEARGVVECMWVKHSDVIKACTYMSARNNGGFSTANNLVLGGLTPDGEDAVCDFTYVCLDAEETVFNSEPNTSVRVSSKNPDAFVERVLEILVHKEGGKMPMFNDDVIIPELIRDGLTEAEAHNYAIVGCVEPTGLGNTFGSTNAGFFNLAKCLELAIHDGVCQMSGKQMGPKTGTLTEMSTFEDVQQAFETQVNYFVDLLVCSLNCTEKMIGEYGPHIYCSMLLDGCMENGRDCTRGGAKYNYIGVQGVGSVDVADSLTAIRRMIFEEKTISAQELLDAMKDNFEKEEILRQRIIHKVPKYGNDIAEADAMEAWVAGVYTDAVKEKKTVRGGHFRPGLFCLSSNTPLGKQVGALPSGRLSGTPLGDGGISPKHGMDTNGPTAAVRSVASFDHTQAINGVNFNMKFLPTLLQTHEQRMKLVSLIRVYFLYGGMHIQFNVLTKETLLAAQKEPDQYRSLVVRVAGYSAFFIELDKDIQDEIIMRTEQTHL